MAVVAVASAILCLAPQTETVGYELSLALALLCSLAAGHLAALYPSRVREKRAPFPGARHPALIMYLRALVYGLSLAAIGLAVALLNTLRVPPCNLAEGLAFAAAMPIPSVALAAAFGLLCGLATPGRRSASLLWFLLWIGSIALALVRFRSSPAVFVFGPFFGYFPGVLYDTLISVDHRLLTYRAAGLVHCCLAISACGALLDPATLRLSPGRLRERTSARIAAALLCVVALALALAAPALGHRAERSDLLAALPVERAAGEGLVLHFSGSIPPGTIEELSEDARFDLHMVEDFLGAGPGPVIDVFFFDDPEQKGRLMGASRTNVAKPWRAEVYVVVEPSPHEVLRHELAHAVAARFGRGPFAVAGAAGGIWPDPGLIEGVAVAAGGPRSDLTDHQWAAAMRREGILPRTERLFGMGFLNLPASTAYTAAGSFCGWLRGEQGAGALRAIYGGASWEEATGRSLAELSAAWAGFLDGIPLGAADLAAARYRFDRPSVIGSVCVHEVARLHREAGRRMEHERYDEALGLLEAAHARSGGATSTRSRLFDGLVRSGSVAAVREMGRELLDDSSTGAVRRLEVRETLADLDAEAHPRQVTAAFRELAALTPDEADRRRLQMKGHLSSIDDPAIRPLILALARIPGPEAPADPLLMLDVAAAAAARPDDPWLAYLVARQRHRLEDHAGAVKSLDRFLADGAGATSPELALSARMMRGISLFRMGDPKVARAGFEEIAGDRSLREGARALAGDWAKRCAFMIGHKQSS
jgi:hypothetical protein